MLVSDEIRGRLIAFTVLAMMLVPALAAAAPTVSEQSQTPTYSEQIGDWWENTNMDKDRDYIHDAIWIAAKNNHCLLYTSPSPRDRTRSRMPSSA